MKRRFSNGFSIELVLFFFIMLCLFACQTLRALPVENQIWDNIIINKSFVQDSPWLYILQGQYRFNLEHNSYENAFLLGGLGYRCSPQISWLAGYRWFAGNQIHRTRAMNQIWQIVTWNIVQEKRVNFFSQSRFEERNRVDESQWNQRYRQKLQLKFPRLFFNTFSPLISDEIFVNLNKPVWVRNQETLEQNRAYVGVAVPLSKNFEFEVGYLNQYLFRIVRNRMNNIYYVSLNIT